MPRVLAYSSWQLNHVFVMVPTLLELRSRGYEVSLGVVGRTHAPPFIGGIPVRHLSWRDVGATQEPGDPYVLQGPPTAAGLRGLVEEIRPDLLLVDAQMWGGVVAAEASGLPWARIAHSPLHIRGMGPDVRGPGLAPVSGPWSGARRRVTHARRRRVDARYLLPINALRRAHGLAPVRHPWDLHFNAPLTLAYTAEPFEYPRTDWPMSLRFVGPATWDEPGGDPQWASRLDSRPLVLVSASSGKGNPAGELPVDPILEGLSDPAIQVAVTLPRGPLPFVLPENARVAPYVPHSAIIPHAVAVVCHGGAGVVQKSLAAGVPVVAIPNGWDRWEVARRVEVARAGVRLPIHEVTPARIADAVTRARGCTDGARRVGAAFSTAGGPSAAADHIEHLVSAQDKRRPPPR